MLEHGVHLTAVHGDDPLAVLRRHGFVPLALTPAGGIALAQLTPDRRNAVLLGAEGAGLPVRFLDHATTVRIPMAAGLDSLNVATTSGIVLHHLAAATRVPAPG